MAQPVSFPLRLHTNLCPPCDCVKKIFDSISQFVLDIIKKLGEFFYNLCHPGTKDAPTTIREISPMLSQSSPRNILAFYRGEERNNNGIDIAHILQADDQWLESDHQWVQWAFPLEKPSPYNATAPILVQETMEAFRNDPSLKNHILAVFNRILYFYGLKMTMQGQIERGPTFPARAQNWLQPGNHNFLRITRIIHSLGLMLGSPNTYGKAFFDIMENIYLNEGNGIITDASYNIWKNAV